MLELQRILSQGPSSTFASQWNHRGSVLDASGAMRRSARLKSTVSTMEPSGSIMPAMRTTPDRHTMMRRVKKSNAPPPAFNSSSHARIKSNDERFSAGNGPELYTKPFVLRRNSLSTASTAGGGTRSPSWSAKDDEVLVQARAQGLNWNQISPKHFPNKSPNACRKRHERLMERQNAEQWDGVKLDILSQAYMEARREMWCVLAARVGEKWTLVEQKCMEKGLKNLTQAYRSAQKKQNDGAYHDHEDSGVGMSDYGDSTEPAGVSHSLSVAEQARIPSIQAILDFSKGRPQLTADHPRREQQNDETYCDHVDSGVGMSECNDLLDQASGSLSLANMGQVQTPAMQSILNPSGDDSVEDSPVHTPPSITLQEMTYGTESPTADHGVADASAIDSDFSAVGRVEVKVERRYGDSQKSLSPHSISNLYASSASQSLGDEAVDLSEEFTDDSGLDSSTDIDKQKEELLDRLMLHFYDLFAYTQFSQHSGNTSSSPGCSSSPKQSAQAPSRMARTSGRKRKSDESIDKDGGEEEEDDNDKPSKRTNGTNEPNTLETPAARRLACPYYKKHKGRYQPSRACAGPGWFGVHRLKEHLYREHSMPLHCRRCYITFENEAQLTDHSRSSDSCVMRDAQPVDGFDKDQEKKLKSRRSMFRAESEEHKWKIVYLILFPNTAPTELPSPYYDFEADPDLEQPEYVSPKPPEFKQFGAYMSRELPRQVRKALELAMDKTFGPIEETLKNEMENIVRNCQEQLTTSFMNSMQATNSATNAASGPSRIHSTAPRSRDVGSMSTETRTGQGPPEDDLSQYLVPPYATLDSWPDLVNMNSGNLNNAWSESAYFSQTGGPNGSLHHTSWTPYGNDTDLAICTDTICAPDVVALEPSSHTYVGKGKGKAINAVAHVGHVT